MGFLKRLLHGRSADWTPEVEDPVLGTLKLAQGEDWWDATVAIDGQALVFHIGGSGVPDPALVSRAHEIYRDFPAFQRRVMALLAQEAARDAAWAAEIGALRIESIMLGAAKRPEDGMVYFTGPDEDRLWRCDLVAGEPKFLGFDR